MAEHLSDEWRADMAKQYLDLAEKCIDDGNYDGADEHFRTALEQAPAYPPANLEYGFFLMRLGRKEDAETYLRKAMELDPAQYRPYYHLAYIYVSTEGKADEGLALYRKAMEIAPAEHSVLGEYADILLKLGRVADAETAFNEYLGKAGEQPYPYCCLGFAEARKENADLAKACGYYEKGIGLYEKNETDLCEYAWAIYNLAILALQAGNKQRTLDLVAKLLEHNPMGYLELLEADEDFLPLRGDKRFDDLLKRAGDVRKKWLKENATIMPGDKAPDFKLPDLTGKTIKLSDYKGRLVLLNIWATWCGPCRAEIPDIDALYREYKDKGVAVLGVCSEEDIDPDDLAEAAEELGATYPILIGTSKVDKDYISKSGSIPETYIIGPDGRVLDFILGRTEYETLDKKIRKYLPPA